jgi:hypothetical protein
LLAREIHLVGKANEPFEPDRRQMLLRSHRAHDGGEAVEVVSLDDQSVELEERKDLTVSC